MSKFKEFIEPFVSTRMMGGLLLVFAFGIGTATFIEHFYDTYGAQRLVFHATWFKLVLVLLCINFIFNIKRYNLLSKKKWTMLLTHIGLILTIIGAGISHYFGFEGVMQVVEGESVGHMYTQHPYFQASVLSNDKSQAYTIQSRALKLSTAPLLDNSFEITENPFNQGEITFKYKNFIDGVGLGPYKTNVANGIDHLELVFEKMESEYLASGNSIIKSGVEITFNNPKPNAINIYGDTANLTIDCALMLTRFSMQTKELDTLVPGSHPFLKKHLHNLPNGVNMVLKNFLPKAKQEIVPVVENGRSLLILNVTHNGENKNAYLWGGKSQIPPPLPFNVGGMDMILKYGSIEKDLPFRIFLRDFIHEKYPGTNNSSSFKSLVTVTDEAGNGAQDFAIFMNNVLDYQGYRVFQSSYSETNGREMSVFSVNYDKPGTLISYLGYIILGLGFVLSMFNKNSRFVKVFKDLKKLQAKKNQSLITGLLFLFGVTTFQAQKASEVTFVSKEHAEKANSLLVMSYIGRIMPFNSLAYDFIRKLHRKDYYEVPETGIKLLPEQVLLDVVANPSYWIEQPFIKFDSRTGFGKEIGVEGKYLKYTDLYTLNLTDTSGFISEKVFTKTNDAGVKEEYTFNTLVSQAEQKLLKDRNVFDKEVLKVNERISIFSQGYNGMLHRFFPIPKQIDSIQPWISWEGIGNDLDLSVGEIGKAITARSLMLNYLNSIIDAKQTGDYTDADFMVELIGKYQRKTVSPKVLPSESLVKLEVTYNKLNLFGRLKFIYLFLSLILLPLTLWDEFSVKTVNWRSILLKVINAIFLLAVMAHAINLGLRWYIVGHAPWSDGYEALTFIAFGVALTGLLFYRSSKTVTGAAALMAFLILMTAGHNKYDPQMTALEPVLKSYWLIIHVACLTLSYSFFGLSFILSLINMGIFTFRSNANRKVTDITIKELSGVNELTMTIGLALATIGTFLGGVWANESWGRYWGWDAKETWALVIVIVYAFVLHMRFIPGLRGKYALNLASALSFATVLMTFIGVNYYLTKGLHSYARGDQPVFPSWAWVTIAAIILLLIIAGVRNKLLRDNSSLSNL